jgi:hypothetical protein
VQPEATLLDIIRRKALGLPVNENDPAGLPLRDLMEMDLRSLLLVIRVLGRHRLLPKTCTNRRDLWECVLAASGVLSHWPNNFLHLLKDIVPDAASKETHGIKRQFESIYNALFKRPGTGCRGEFNFLKRPFLEFATSEWGDGYAERKMLKSLNGRMPGVLLTQSEFAAHLGVGMNTAARMLKSKIVPCRRVPWGKATRILVDINDCVVPHDVPGTVLTSIEAAKKLGIPLSVFSSLKDEKVFVVNHLVSRRGGVHLQDIQAFTLKLVSLAPTVPSDGASDRCVDLKSVLLRSSCPKEIKPKLVKALFARSLKVVRNTDGTIGGLCIERSAYEQFLATFQVEKTKSYMVPKEIAAALHCDQMVAQELIQMGLLCRTNEMRGLRASTESVRAFQQKYISLTTVANEAGTCSRMLIRDCKNVGICLTFVPRPNIACPQPFIRVSDREVLLRAFLKRSKETKARLAVRTRNYFERLQIAFGRARTGASEERGQVSGKTRP